MVAKAHSRTREADPTMLIRYPAMPNADRDETRNLTCWSLTSKFVEEACHREHKLIMPKVELIIREAHLSSPKTELMTPEVHLTVRIVSLTDRISSLTLVTIIRTVVKRDHKRPLVAKH